MRLWTLTTERPAPKTIPTSTRGGGAGVSRHELASYAGQTSLRTSRAAQGPAGRSALGAVAPGVGAVRLGLQALERTVLPVLGPSGLPLGHGVASVQQVVAVASATVPVYA